MTVVDTRKVLEDDHQGTRPWMICWRTRSPASSRANKPRYFAFRSMPKRSIALVVSGTSLARRESA